MSFRQLVRNLRKMNEMKNVLEAIAEEFEKYPFDSYTGIEVGQIIRSKIKTG